MKLRTFAILQLILITVLIFTVMPLTAQNETTDDTIALNFDEGNGSIGITNTFSTTAEVKVTLGGQLYKIDVPVEIAIDASSALADAKLTAAAENRVGEMLVAPI